REAGGVSVLAHPGSVTRDDDLPLTLLEALAEAGLYGIEVGHREHGEAERTRRREVARGHDLLTTRGSDFHGTGKDNELGENLTAAEVLEEIAARATSGTRILRPWDRQRPSETGWDRLGPPAAPDPEDQGPLRHVRDRRAWPVSSPAEPSPGRSGRGRRGSGAAEDGPRPRAPPPASPRPPRRGPGGCANATGCGGGARPRAARIPSARRYPSPWRRRDARRRLRDRRGSCCGPHDRRARRDRFHDRRGRTPDRRESCPDRPGPRAPRPPGPRGCGRSRAACPSPRWGCRDR